MDKRSYFLANVDRLLRIAESESCQKDKSVIYKYLMGVLATEIDSILTLEEREDIPSIDNLN